MKYPCENCKLRAQYDKEKQEELRKKYNFNKY